MSRKRIVFMIVGVLAAGMTRTWADGDAIAIVQGTGVDQKRFHDLLEEAYGLNVLQQVIALELVKAEAKTLKLEVTAVDVDREFRDALRRIAPGAGADQLSDDDRSQALQKMLDDKGISMVEFKLAIERNAYLRKIVSQQIVVDEKALREQFARTYGEKVVVRAIQTNDLDRASTAVKQLQAGADFADVARKFTVNEAVAADGGLLPAFSYKDSDVPAQLREIAFNLAVGETSSPTKTDFGWYILKVEKRIPPESVRLEDVRGTVEQAYREDVILRNREPFMLELWKKADQQGKIRILDPKLKQKYDELRRKNAALDLNPEAGKTTPPRR